MSATAKDLKYYLEHPDEMPTDPKEIERWPTNTWPALWNPGPSS
jgi:hypothetical protein